MIPKIIHYVWVGDNEKPDIVTNCINSWKKHLPEYEIMEWGNDLVKEINCTYVQQAFEMKKWAFVSDYIRLKVLYEYGGFYFDTDLEVTQPLDIFRDLDFFSGFEDFGGSEKVYPITALIGAVKELKLVQNLLSEYDNECFIEANGDLNLKTNTKRITEMFKKSFGLPSELNPLTPLTLKDRHVIFPSNYFSTPIEGKPNFAIHHFEGSWHENFKRVTFFKFFGLKLALARRINKSKPFNYHLHGDERLIKSLFTSPNINISLIRRI